MPILIIIAAVAAVGSEVASHYIDKNTQKAIEESKKLQAQYQAEADENRQDAAIYQLYTDRAIKQKQQTIQLTNQLIQQDKMSVYTLSFLLLFAFTIVYYVFKLVFGWSKKTTS